MNPTTHYLDSLEAIVLQNIIPMFATCPQKKLSFFGVRDLEQVLGNPYYATMNPYYAAINPYYATIKP